MPSSHVLPSGVCRVPTALLLERIRNPFECPVWDGCEGTLQREQVVACLANGNLASTPHDALSHYPLEWHAQRVAYIAKQIKVELGKGHSLSDVLGQLGPLDLELPIPGLNHYPRNTLADGYHRLAALILLEIAEAQVSLSGDVFEMLQWARFYPDKTWVRRFEIDFIRVHGHFDCTTGLLLQA